MTMTLNEQRDIIQAAIDGKELQWRDNSELGQWHDIVCPVPIYTRFLFASCEYRVKPKPREWWVPESAADMEGRCYTSLEKCRAAWPNEPIVHFKEVEVIQP